VCPYRADGRPTALASHRVLTSIIARAGGAVPRNRRSNRHLTRLIDLSELLAFPLGIKSKRNAHHAASPATQTRVKSASGLLVSHINKTTVTTLLLNAPLLPWMPLAPGPSESPRRVRRLSLLTNRPRRGWCSDGSRRFRARQAVCRRRFRTGAAGCTNSRTRGWPVRPGQRCARGHRPSTASTCATASMSLTGRPRDEAASCAASWTSCHGKNSCSGAD